MKTPTLFRVLIAVILAATLSACAGSAADNDFRSKVSEVDVSGTGGATADGTVSAGANAKFMLRDPNAVASAKPAAK